MTNGAVPASRISRTEAALWCAVAVAAAVLGMYALSGVRLGNDSYQYLSTTDNILAGRGIASSIVHFDVQYATGRLPAPQTTFPPGYPLLVAAVALALGEVERAALVVSLLAAGVAVFALVTAARALELGPATTRFVAFAFVTNAATLAFAVSALTEMLFTAITMTALVCLIAADRATTPARRIGWVAAGAVLCGVSYWVRYAGIFLVAAVVLLHLWRLVRRRTPRAWAECAVASTSGVFVVAGMLRNTWLTGSIRGGNEKIVDRDLVSVLERYATSAYHLVFGEATLATDLWRPGPLEATLVAAGAAAIAMIAWTSRGGVAVLPRTIRPSVGLLAIYGAVYVAGMLYLGTATVITVGPRMLYPMLPIGLLGAGLVLASAERAVRGGRVAGAFIACLVVLSATVAAVNVRSLVREDRDSRHDVVAARLAAPTADGRSLASRLGSEIARDTPVVAMDGQATAYVLRRPVLSLVSLDYSQHAWTEDRVREIAARFGADLILVYRDGDVARRLGAQSAFLAGLVRGAAPPWMTLVAENGAAALYRMTPDATSAATALRRPPPHPRRP